MLLLTLSAGLSVLKGIFSGRKWCIMAQNANPLEKLSAKLQIFTFYNTR